MRNITRWRILKKPSEREKKGVLEVKGTVKQNFGWSDLEEICSVKQSLYERCERQRGELVKCGEKKSYWKLLGK